MKRKKKYGGRLFTRERIYICGDRMEVQVYPVFQKPGARRAKSAPCSEVQARLNERNSVSEAIRIAEANFREGDLALHLTYTREPEGIQDAQRLLGNYLRKLRRAYRKQGLELKYMKRTERGKKSGRIHHHLYISGGLGRDEIEGLWGMGRCNSRRLQFGEDGIEGLTAYIAGQGKARDTYRRWSCSRSCVRPVPEEHDGRISAAEADALGEAAEMGLGYNLFEEMYPGWRCVRCDAVRNETNRGWYTCAVLRRKE